MMPLASVPVAHADFGLDGVLDSIVDSLNVADAAALDLVPFDAASVLDGAAADNALFDLINAPTVLLLGHMLVGDGYSIGGELPALFGAGIAGGAGGVGGSGAAAPALDQPDGPVAGATPGGPGDGGTGGTGGKGSPGKA